MYFDGSLKLEGGGAGVLFISPKGEQLKYVLQILFEVSNNEAEYEALLHGLRLAISLGIKRLLVFGDSIIVVQQVNKELMSFPNFGLPSQRTTRSLCTRTAPSFSQNPKSLNHRHGGYGHGPGGFDG